MAFSDDLGVLLRERGYEILLEDARRVLTDVTFDITKFGLIGELKSYMQERGYERVALTVTQLVILERQGAFNGRVSDLYGRFRPGQNLLLITES